MELNINSLQSAKHPSFRPLKSADNNSFLTNDRTINTLAGAVSSVGKIPFGNINSPLKASDFLLPQSCSPDIYQIEAAQALKKGNNTVVTAPTGTGKTAIAHFIIKKNFEEGKKTFYTTPLKALSNQKYLDLKKLFGDENVGILTGDRKENTTAPIMIMTTEIYRNMAASNYYEERNEMLDNLQTVVFDEFHYMGDPDRGSVWEESIMYTPRQTQILALSATVGNNKKITAWINEKKHKPTSLIDVPTSNRHVPLKFITVGADSETQANRHENMPKRLRDKYRKRFQKTATQKRRKDPMPVINLIDNLNKTEKLPAIVFVFSKAYAQNLLDTSEVKGKDLTTKEEKAKIKETIQYYKDKYGFYSNNLNEAALLKGYAIHSAAILPMQKQLIEELFNNKLIKTVYATETLAAGINMPARTVIMTDAEKPGPSTQPTHGKNFMRPLSPNEFHQMSGRAGRRGIDKTGYVILLADSIEKEALFDKLVNSSPNSVNSSFKIDASSVTEFYKRANDIKGLSHILDKTFSLYELSDVEREKRFKEHMQTFNDYSDLLETYGFIKHTPGGLQTTAKGELISEIKGKPQIPVVQTLLKGFLNNTSPVELAGLLAAIAVPPGVNANRENNQSAQFKLDKSSLNKINFEIDKILKNDLQVGDDKLSSSNSNDQILNAIERRFKTALNKDIYTLYAEKQKLNEEFNELQQSKYALGNTPDINREISEIYSKLRKVQRDINVKNKYRTINSLLEQRLGLSAYKYEKSGTQYLEIYKELEQMFDKYNKKVSELHTPSISQATLNPTIMLFVKKWAELNADSDDYTKNWDTICAMLKDSGSVRYEGDLFNAIAQTIDFIHQFEDVICKAVSLKEKPEDFERYNSLFLKCQSAVRLLKQPPLFNVDDI